MTATDIVQKLWNYCNVLRDDGMSMAIMLSSLLICCFLRWQMSVQSSLTNPTQPDKNHFPASWLFRIKIVNRHQIF